MLNVDEKNQRSLATKNGESEIHMGIVFLN